MKTYTSSASRYTIHWPAVFVDTVAPNGDPAKMRVQPPPTEFFDGQYTARDEEEAKRLDAHPGFRKDFFPVPTAHELEEKRAESKKSRKAQLEAELAALEAEEGQSKPKAAKKSEKPDLTELDGSTVNTKTEALEALAAAGGDVSFADGRTSVKRIVEEAEKQGFSFKGWPAE